VIDTDNSGQITFEELKVGLRRFGANLTEAEIYSLLRAVRSSNYFINVIMLAAALDLDHNVCFKIAGRC
jgi:Ca2+-binding EF-hand superfamily protein